MKIAFQCTIVADVKDTPEIIEAGLSIMKVCAKLNRGEFDIEVPTFIYQPTVLLKEKQNGSR